MTVEPLPHIDRSPDVEYKTAYDVEYLLVTPPKHELVRKKVLRLADILEYPLILRRPSAAARRRVEEVFHRHKLSQK